MNKKALTTQALIITLICIFIFVMVVIALINFFPLASERFFEWLKSINPLSNIFNKSPRI